MTAPWTPRERALREALKIARPMMNRIDHNVGVYEKELEAEALVDALLADPPPPDPRDEALDAVEVVLDTIVMRLENVDYGTVIIAQSGLAAIAAAKGGK